jgi:hypothetical protein
MKWSSGICVGWDAADRIGRSLGRAHHFHIRKLDILSMD